MAFLPACLLAAIAAAGVGPAPAADLPRVAVFDFELIDSSLEARRPDQDRRLRALTDELRDQLARSGRFAIVDIEPVRARLDRAPALSGCNRCEVDMARDLGADFAMTGIVRKVSTLILGIQLVLTEVSTGAPRLAATASIRGDTDESWLHGLRWLLRHRVLPAAEEGKL